MKEYEQKKYERWRDETEQSLPLLMKRTLLVMVNSSGVVTGEQPPLDMVHSNTPLGSWA